MAYEAINQEDEQKAQQGFGTQGTQNINQTTQAENIPTLGGQQSDIIQGVSGQQSQQVQGGQTNTSTGQKSSGMGARLSNLKKYIEGNRNSGMAQKIQGGIENIRTGLQGGIGQSQAKLQEQSAAERARLTKGEQLIKASNEGGLGVLERGRTESYAGINQQPIQQSQNVNLVAKTDLADRPQPSKSQTDMNAPEVIQPQVTPAPIQQAPDFTQYGQTAEERLGAFKKYREGEAQKLDIENQIQLEQQAKELQKRADLSQSESGRYQLLRETFNRPAYTTGQQRLDQLILQARPEESAVLSKMAKEVNIPVQQKLQELQSLKEAENKAIREQATGLAGNIGKGLYGEVGKPEYDQFGQLKKVVGGAFGGFEGELNTKQQEALNKIQNEYNIVKDKLARGEPVTQQEIERVTNVEKQNLTDFMDYYKRGVKQTIGEKLKSGIEFTPEEQEKVAQNVAPLLNMTPEEYNTIKSRQPMNPNTFNENRRIILNDRIAASYGDGRYMFGLPEGKTGPFTTLSRDANNHVILKDANGGVFETDLIENKEYTNYLNAINTQKQQLDQLTSQVIQQVPQIANFRSLSDIDYSQYLGDVAQAPIGTVASAEDYARQEALSKLANLQYGPLNQAELAQAGTIGGQDVGKFSLEQALSQAREFYNKPDYQTYGRVGVAETPAPEYVPLENLVRMGENVGGIVEGASNLNLNDVYGSTGQLAGNFAFSALNTTPIADVEKFLTGGENIKNAENSIRNMGSSIASSVGTFWCTMVFQKGLASSQELRKVLKFLKMIVFTHARFLSWYIDNGERIGQKATSLGFDWKVGRELLFNQLLEKFEKKDLKGAVECYDKFTVYICKFIGEKPPYQCRKNGYIDSLRFLPKVLNYYLRRL